MEEVFMDSGNLKKLWKKYLEGGNLQEGEVRDIILESWQRCTDLGVDPWKKRVERTVRGREFQEILQKNEKLLRISIPYIETLYEFTKGSGFVIALTDADGVILTTIGDEPIKENIRKGGFEEGADWSEISAGTNAVGTALVTESPLQVFSSEHFCRYAQITTCCSAIIRDPDEKIVGTVCLSAYDYMVNSHTLGMAVSTAGSIKNALIMMKTQDEYNLANTYKSILMDSVSQGVLAVDAQGRITLINVIARRFLQVDESSLGKSIWEIFNHANNKDLSLLLRERREVTDKEITLVTARQKGKFTLTSRVIMHNANNFDGLVMIIDEISRVKKIVQRLSGAIASITFDDLAGNNRAYLKTVEMAKHAAQTDSNVLLLGESGTGKDIFAQAIHNHNIRSKEPFVAINCSALPRELLGSELFGYVEGAFTGARKGGSQGKFELADGGTIFLDEIGDMPLDMQGHLLRVLEEKRILRIGGHEMIPVDVRVIAATNRDLPTDIKNGRFRRDLYYRLNVVSIHMIPLRERVDDIAQLARFFYQKLALNLNKSIYPIPENFIRKLEAYPFPGNIRELQNVIERSLNLSPNGRLDVSLLPAEILSSEKPVIPVHDNGPMPRYKLAEKEKLVGLLEKHTGNLSKVAAEMGVARSTLYRHLDKLGLGYYRKHS